MHNDFEIMYRGGGKYDIHVRCITKTLYQEKGISLFKVIKAIIKYSN